MNRFLPFFLSSIILSLFLATATLAQSSNCVKGDFVKDLGSSSKLLEAESKFCAEIRENSELLEIQGFVLGERYAKIVRVFKDKVVFTDYEDNVRYKERSLTEKEAKTLRHKITEANPATQPPIRDFKRCFDMCSQFEFLSIDRNGGQRVSIFAPRYSPPEPMDKLADFFNQLEKSGNFIHHYYIQDKVKSFELVVADKNLSTRAVWKKGNDFRLLVEDESKWEDNFDDARKYFENSTPTSGTESYEERLKRLKRRTEIENAHYSWRRFDKGNIGEIIAAPDEIPYFETNWRYTANGDRYFSSCVSESD